MHIPSFLEVSVLRTEAELAAEILDTVQVFEKEGLLRGLAALEDLFLHYAGTDDDRADFVLDLMDHIWPVVQVRFTNTVRRYLNNNLYSV